MRHGLPPDVWQNFVFAAIEGLPSDAWPIIQDHVSSSGHPLADFLRIKTIWSSHFFTRDEFVEFKYTGGHILEDTPRCWSISKTIAMQWLTPVRDTHRHGVLLQKRSLVFLAGAIPELGKHWTEVWDFHKTLKFEQVIEVKEPD